MNKTSTNITVIVVTIVAAINVIVSIFVIAFVLREKEARVIKVKSFT